jgi:hypothetical protein
VSRCSPAVRRAALLLLGLLPAAAHPEGGVTVEQWAKAKAIHYRVEGVYSVRRGISAAGAGAVADVMDKVAFEVDWSLKRAQIVKMYPVENFPAQVAAVEDVDAKCPPPLVKGAFDLEIVEVSPGYSGDLMLHLRTHWAGAETAESCPGGRKLLAARTTMDTFTLPVVSPALLGMPRTTFVVSPSRNAFSLEQGDWMWTYTPTEVVPDR